MISILLSACALSVWGTPCATEDCEDLELLTVKSQKPELERPFRPFHRGDEDDLRYLVFPVQGDYAWNIINRKRHKVTVTARGGGTRAMAGTIGQLRALKDMNLLDEVDQILAISGATWATAVYLFADKSYSSEDLLGATTFGKLANLTLDAIRTPHGELIKSANAPRLLLRCPHVLLIAFVETSKVVHSGKNNFIDHPATHHHFYTWVVYGIVLPK